MLFRQISLALVSVITVTGSSASLLAQAPAPRSLGIDTANFDRSFRPQDDLFRFVTGGWLKRTPIPSEAPSWGTLDELGERSRESMRAILEQAAASNAPAGSEERKVGD